MGVRVETIGASADDGAAGALGRMRALVDALREIDTSAWRDLDAVLDEVALQIRRLLGANHAGVQLRVPGSADFVRRRPSPLATSETGVFEPGRRFRPDALAQAAIDTGRAIFVRDFHAEARVDAAVRAVLPGVASTMVAPMVAEDETIGFLFAHWDQPRDAGPGDVEIVGLLAHHAALVVRVARALADAREAHAEAETAHGRTAFLAAAAATLASSLDYEATLGQVAHLVVPGMADWCAIDLVEAGGRLRRIAAVHADPSKGAIAHALREMHPSIEPGAEHTAARVLRTGESWLDAEVSPTRLVAQARSSAHARLLAELGFGSEMVVPLAARGSVLGTITMVAERPGRYGQRDLDLAEELASRCALAIDNARLYRDAQNAARAREEFLSVAAHELRTPITALRGFAQLTARHMARDGTVEPERLKLALGQIDSQSRRLSALIEQLLDVARLESGRLAIEPEPTDLVSLLGDLVGRLQSIHHDHPIQLQAPGSLGADVDPIRLEQVVTNLIDNAARFSPEGTPIELDLTADGGATILSVRDHGIGIPEGDRARVFDRFVQVHAERRFGGMGLGLYVSRQIVELHGGTIAIETPEGPGTRVVLRLPLAR